MAQATLSVAPKRYRRQNSAIYYAYNAGEKLNFYNSYVLFECDFGDDVTNLSNVSFRFHLSWTATASFQESIFVYKHEPALNLADYDSTAHFALGTSGSKEFTLNVTEPAEIPGNKIWFAISKDSRLTSGTCYVENDGCTATVEVPPTVATPVSPKNTTFDVSDKIDFSWNVSGEYSSSQLRYSTDGAWKTLATVSNTNTKFTADASKFPAGQINWQVRAYSDVLGWGDWSSSASFTVQSVGATVTLTAPTSGSKDGASAITFGWTITEGSGIIKTTQMAYSTDNGLTWTNLIDQAGKVESYKASAGKFSAGKITWRVRAEDSYSGWSVWKQASFTVSYTGATVSLTTPTSGTVDGSDAITFGWTITPGGGTIKTTQMAYSTDDGLTWTTLINQAGKVESYTASAGKFSAGKITWRVRAEDSYSGWSAWKTASFTVSYAGPTINLTTPTSGSKDGGQKIQFAWTITAGSGTLTGTQMEYSVDDGINWVQVFNASGERTSYEAAPGLFPAGKITWHVRAKNAYSGWSAWKQASFTVSYISPTINLTTPTSGSKDGSQTIQFSWSISAGSGSIKSTQMEYSTDDGLNWQTLVDASGTATSYTANAAKFPAGKVSWRVRAKDSYSGWSDWKTASFSVQYTAVSEISPVNSPTSGRISASKAQTYAVALTPSAPVYTPFTLQSATMYWRTGTSGDYTAVPMTASGANASVVIAGGTFPSGTIQWYAEAVDNTGATRTTEVYTLLALNAAVEAVPQSPINTIEGTSSEISFAWLYYSLDGTEQSRAVLEYSRDGESWDTIANVPGSGTTYTAPAGFFTSAGVVYWRVQAFNASGTAGPKSAAVSFTLYGSSSVTYVIGDGKPFATISWQAEGQVSYELMVGDKHIGPYFGADVRSYKLAEPLEDGLYTVRVRIQNKYGIWSEWAEAEMSVQGTGIEITIEGYSGREPYSAYIDIVDYIRPFLYFMIYRDGKYIGKTTSTFFIDRFTTGIHTYQVFQALPDGDVTRSNKITINVRQNCPVIAPLAGGEFIELCLSTDADRAQDIQHSREVVHVHYSGSRFPSSEIGEAETMSVSFDVAWKQTDKAAADAFEALIGEDVILKTPGGYVIVGTLEGYELHDQRFDKSYRCTLQQGDWRDFVNVKS